MRWPLLPATTGQVLLLSTVDHPILRPPVIIVPMADRVHQRLRIHLRPAVRRRRIRLLPRPLLVPAAETEGAGAVVLLAAEETNCDS